MARHRGAPERRDPAALGRGFYDRPSVEVAPDLLNKVLVVADLSVRIVEVEAYGGSDDPASHAFRGRTGRNATMFGPAGHLYVYFVYGMHFCANAVCGPEGCASAVLVRAAAPISGIEEMALRRGASRSHRELCSGPARLCQAMGIDGSFDGEDLVERGPVRIVDDGTPPPGAPGTGQRVGVSLGVDAMWRWFVPDDPNVSRPR